MPPPAAASRYFNLPTLEATDKQPIVGIVTPSTCTRAILKLSIKPVWSHGAQERTLALQIHAIRLPEPLLEL